MRSRLFESLIVAFVLSTAGYVGAADESWRAKVDPWVLDTGRSQTTEFLVYLDQQADLSEAAALPTKAEKGAFVHRTLSELAERTQTPALAALAARAVEHRSYWIANMIWVRGGIDTVLIPKENERDLKEVPDNIKEHLKICPVKWIDEVLAIALESMPEPLSDEEFLADALSAASEAENDEKRVS